MEPCEGNGDRHNNRSLKSHDFHIITTENDRFGNEYDLNGAIENSAFLVLPTLANRSCSIGIGYPVVGNRGIEALPFYIFRHDIHFNTDLFL